jgi:hypothetical protein
VLFEHTASPKICLQLAVDEPADDCRDAEPDYRVNQPIGHRVQVVGSAGVAENQHDYADGPGNSEDEHADKRGPTPSLLAHRCSFRVSAASSG